MQMFRSSHRRAALLAVAVVAAGTLAACGDKESATGSGSASNAGDETVNLAAFILASENTYSQASVEGMEAAAEKLGNVDLTIFDGKFDGAHQASQIRDAVASGRFNAFVVFSNDGAAVAPAVRQAAENDITTVAAYAPIGPDIFTGEPQVEGVVGTVWHNDPLRGEWLGELAIAACEQEHPDADPCQVGYLSGGNAIAFEKAKLESFTDSIAGADQRIEIVAQQEGGFLPGPSRTATQNILQANPDLDVIATTGDQMTLGAEQAIDAAGRGGEISLMGSGATTQGIQAVEEGRWFATQVSMPRTEGELAATMAIEAVRGNLPEETDVVVPERSPIGRAVTRETTKSSFEAEWSV